MGGKPEWGCRALSYRREHLTGGLAETGLAGGAPINFSLGCHQLRGIGHRAPLGLISNKQPNDSGLAISYFKLTSPIKQA